jgi:hypothetical protein
VTLRRPLLLLLLVPLFALAAAEPVVGALVGLGGCIMMDGTGWCPMTDSTASVAAHSRPT